MIEFLFFPFPLDTRVHIVWASDPVLMLEIESIELGGK